jgi:hypothetical protein
VLPRSFCKITKKEETSANKKPFPAKDEERALVVPPCFAAENVWLPLAR